MTLAGEDRIATIHYSANCRLNRRLLVLHGSRGVITLDVLADAAALSRVPDRRWRRAAGDVTETAERLLRLPWDRAGYLADRLRGRTPHRLLIEQFAGCLLRGGEPPTPLDEIDYVVRNAELIARQLEPPAAGTS